METKNNPETGVEEAGDVHPYRSGDWMSQVRKWIDSAPVFLKPERIQKSAMVHRPSTVALEGRPATQVGEARSLIDRVRAVLQWIESAPAFLLEVFGLCDNDQNDNQELPGS